jgi:hypothetical protein
VVISRRRGGLVRALKLGSAGADEGVMPKRVRVIQCLPQYQSTSLCLSDLFFYEPSVACTGGRSQPRIASLLGISLVAWQLAFTP